MQHIALGFACLLALPMLVIVAPILVVDRVLDKRRRLRLWRQFQAKWGAAGKRGLLIYSNSPHWQAYIEERWLPQLESDLVVLNWSQRKQWPHRHALEAEIFRRYLGYREFNPAAIIFSSNAEVRVVRFWQPFRDFKHGKDRALRAAEAELFGLLGVNATVGA